MNFRGFSYAKTPFNSSFFKSKTHFSVLNNLHKSSFRFANLSNGIFLAQLTNYSAISLNRLSSLQLTPESLFNLKENRDAVEETEGMLKQTEDSQLTIEKVAEMIRNMGTMNQHNGGVLCRSCDTEGQ